MDKMLLVAAMGLAAAVIPAGGGRIGPWLRGSAVRSGDRIPNASGLLWPPASGAAGGCNGRRCLTSMAAIWARL